MTVERMCQLGGISRSGFYRIESRSEGVDRDVELRDAIQRFVGHGITLVDSAANCALAVKKQLEGEDLASPETHVGGLSVAATDATDGFLRVAEKALGLKVGNMLLRTVQSGV